MTTTDMILSTIIGMLSSYLVWYLIYKLLVPRIRFSDKISKMESIDSKSKYKYRIKLENSGYRDIIDINISAKFSIIGLNGKSYQNRNIVYLETSFDGYIPILRSLKTLNYFLKKVEKNNSDNIHKTLRNLIRVYPNKKKEFSREYYPDYIKNKVKKEELTMEDIFNIGSDAFLEIIFSGTDSFSNSKKIYVKKYTLKDIINKPFKTGSLSINNEN
ncbi:MAG: hypothetical protein RO257_01825 [Candidatus Kapabacteria bacterium]|nr:hypothetical protein [Candidatus Kapabacteria bacterium]